MHIPVLQKEVEDGLVLDSRNVVVDATINGGGHAKMIVGHLGESGHLIGVDVDSTGLDRSKELLRSARCKVTLIKGNFRHLSSLLIDQGTTGVDRILFDLGWSSNQIEDPERGFSFLHDGPLLMTLESGPGNTPYTLTAHDIVNIWTEDQLEKIIRYYGEERFSRRIAQAIVTARAQEPITRTTQLAEIISRSVPIFYRKHKIHPATKTFQALRITVNDEYQALEEGLSEAQKIISPGGRILVISFHSLEDRLVKRTFRAWEQQKSFHTVTKKPIVATQRERKANRRSRSAKLRIIERID